jgi:glycosyltransferase involved in cell wall biosynthesis
MQEQAGQQAGVKDAARVLHVAYVLAYRAPRYIRTESLLEALRACPNVKLSIARNARPGIGRYIETWRALRRLRTCSAPDVYVLGFRGHEFFWPLRWLSEGKPLLFDALMSPYAALRDERTDNLVRRILAWLLYPLERSTMRHADLVLTDTQLHVDFYARTFGLPVQHLFALPVGAIELATNVVVSPQRDHKPFSVLFYGSFLPLHGMAVIVAAAALLTDLPIQFDFIGGSKAQARGLRDLCKASGVTNFTYRRWVELDQLLLKDIPNADLCLGGPFGDTPQARRVITTKTSQCLALGKATVIGEIDEDYGFVDRRNCLLVPQGDAGALAASIRWSFENRALLPELGARGRDAYQERLSISVIATHLQAALTQLASNATKTQAR